MNTSLPAARHVIFAALCLALAAPAFAQQQPITGQMMDGRTQASAVTPAPSAPAATMPAATTPSQDLPPPPPPAQAPVATSQDMTSPPPPAYERGIDSAGIGATTRELLHIQVSGNNAGPNLPMLGDEASASYKRYIQSFNHPIPEFFETTVGKNGNSGR